MLNLNNYDCPVSVFYYYLYCIVFINILNLVLFLYFQIFLLIHFNIFLFKYYY